MGAGLSLNQVRKTYAGGSVPVTALDGVDLEVAPGEFVVVVGHNGSGKSTLLSALFGDIGIDSGSVKLINEAGTSDLTSLPRHSRAAFMARVHQDPTRGTVPSLTVWENLRLAGPKISASPFRFASSTEAAARYQPLLAPLGLLDKGPVRAADLSSGQRQLVALLVALERRPQVLLLDEHTAALDARNSRLCMEKAVDLAKQTQTTVIAVTHDLAQALRYGDRLVVLREGRISFEASGEEKKALSIEKLLGLCGYLSSSEGD